MTAALVVPTYQEAENIVPFLRAVREQCPELHILVMDDSSPDGTAALAKDEANSLGGVEVVVRPVKEGLGAAYRHGFRHALAAGYDPVAQMDADFSHRPEVLPSLFDAVAAGADVAVGSRYVPGGSVPNWTYFRRSLSQWGNGYARFMLRLQLRDATTAFRVYTAETLERIDIDGTRANGYLFQIETAFRLSQAGVRIVELPITFLDRVAGASKMAVLRTMVETELRVTWWGVSLRLPGLSERFRSSAPGRFLESKTHPIGPPGSE
ncbi:MAG: polyprenol monophosphomannose synthase [Actinomycetota bacterium]|nr:polyprenol monophosphomannose synthase [Actinomycetota bacterium]